MTDEVGGTEWLRSQRTAQSPAAVANLARRRSGLNLAPFMGMNSGRIIDYVPGATGFRTLTTVQPLAPMIGPALPPTSPSVPPATILPPGVPKP